MESPDQDLRRLVDAARGVWIRRLIDYSRANSLLYFRDLRVGTLDLSAASAAVERLLAGESLPVDHLGAPGRFAEITDPVARARNEADAEENTRNTLLALHRKALSNLEEKGIETLHVAIGMATWPAHDGGRPYDAPVLLLPARIEVRGRGRELRLAVLGEPQVNPVLLYVLEEHHAIRLSAPVLLAECGEEDESGHWHVDHEQLFEKIGAAAAPVKGFAVNRRVVLANFQFAKMAMVEDLKRNGESLVSSPIVAAVAGHAASRRSLGEATVDIEPLNLDDRSASDDYLVLDADSTQHRTIVRIGKGRSGVVQGPPGTGKSQTIANLIAQSVAEGRRVLFVAEKRAALDAVMKRLSHPDVGLGHLVLDLHGASVSRKEVMARLARSLEQIRHALEAEGADAVHREFEARRRALNEHARRVNEVRLPFGLSVIGILGRLLRLPAAAKSEVRLRGEALAALSSERADEWMRCVVEGAANPTLLLGTDPSPWNNANLPDGRRAQEAIDIAKRAASELWPAFERRLEAMVRLLVIRPPQSLDETAELLAVLRDARRVREQFAAEIFTANPGTLARALEPAADGVAARAWAFVTDGAYRAARLRLLSLRATPAPTATLREEARFAQEVLDRWRRFSADADVPVNVEGEAELAASFAALSESTTPLGAWTDTGPFGGLLLSTVASRLRALAADQRTPYCLPGVLALRARFANAGLSRFLDDLRERAVPTEHWGARFEYVRLYSALEEVLASDPSLATFNGRAHDQVVAEFIRLDRERVRLAAARVRRLHGERAIEAMNLHFDQANLVRSEASKKSRHVPVRELLARAPDVLTRIAPCWVASPLSVSQLLDGDKRHFDLVVFDEASQILQEEAIPSLYRADQVVVAGDRHQLPPTTFFATAVEGEDETPEHAEAVEAIGGFESLLGTLEAFLPNWLLEWHYRSEDERLITFSNRNIYTGRLVTFPSARGHDAIRHVLVPHDPTLAGQEESNSREVEEVVRQVLLHAETRPRESLGVITMGIKHANRVQAALDRALESRPELSEFFSTDRDERFFVKNLETVQGDERDAILLSIGYGKSSSGDLPHRFGPLTQEVGHRRLNVAITRARRRMCVVSSFSHDEVDLKRSGSRGTELLKAYLEYAASGGRRLAEDAPAGEAALNAFESDVRAALEARGLDTRPRFGASRVRIDLVAMHPRNPGRPLLAIECDGASYQSGATARDRDRLRSSHLQRLGWRCHRIWSADWFYDREKEIERAVAAYEEAVRRAELSDAEAAPSPTPDAAPPKAAPPAPQPIAPRPRGPRPLIPLRESIDHYGDRELLQIAEWIASDGLLRTDEELLRDLFETLPFQRMGGRIRERLRAVTEAVRGRKERDSFA